MCVYKGIWVARDIAEVVLGGGALPEIKIKVKIRNLVSKNIF